MNPIAPLTLPVLPHRKLYLLKPNESHGLQKAHFIMLSSGKAADLSQFRLEQIKEMASLHNTLEVCSGFGRETRFFIRGFKA